MDAEVTGPPEETAGQLLSPIMSRLKRRWQAEGKLEGITHTSALPDGAISFDGQHQPWSTLMRELLRTSVAPPPVHPAVEPFETKDVGIGARVKLGRSLEQGAFLGCYGGWVGTFAECMLLPRDEAPTLGASFGCGWSDRAAKQLLGRASRTMKVHSYLVRAADISLSPGTTTGIVITAVSPDGEYIGNVLGRINDGVADPYHDRADARDQDDDTAALLRGEEAGAGPPPPLVRSRAPNARFVQIAHGSWIYLGVVTTASVNEGEELLIDCTFSKLLAGRSNVGTRANCSPWRSVTQYPTDLIPNLSADGEQYWVQQRELRDEITRLSAYLVVSAEGTKNRSGFRRPAVDRCISASCGGCGVAPFELTHVPWPWCAAT